MKYVSGIAAITLATSLALLATGCDRDGDNKTAGEKVDDAAATAKYESNEAGNTMNEAGNTMERKADQAGQAIDDAAITTAIKAKYFADDTLKGHEISVETEHGVVSLNGPVQNATARDLATEIAKGVDGVVSVNNNLTTTN